MTAGCTSLLAQTICGFITPYDVTGPDLHAWSFENGVDGSVPPDRELFTQGSAFVNSNIYEDHWVFAVWSASVPTPTPIPEPSGLAVLAAGLLGLSALRKRKAI
jgi:hypothetical protein